MSYEKLSEYGILKPLAVSTAVSILCSLIFMLISAVAVTNLNASENTTLVLSIVSMSIGAFFGGIVCAKIYKKKGFLMGGLNGVVFFLLITVISLAVSSAPITVISLFKLILFIISSVIGGIVGVNTSRKRKF